MAVKYIWGYHWVLVTVPKRCQGSNKGMRWLANVGELFASLKLNCIKRRCHLVKMYVQQQQESVWPCQCPVSLCMNCVVVPQKGSGTIFASGVNSPGDLHLTSLAPDSTVTAELGGTLVLSHRPQTSAPAWLTASYRWGSWLGSCSEHLGLKQRTDSIVTQPQSVSLPRLDMSVHSSHQLCSSALSYSCVFRLSHNRNFPGFDFTVDPLSKGDQKTYVCTTFLYFQLLTF